MSFRTTALLFGIMIGVLWLFGLMLTRATMALVFFVLLVNTLYQRPLLESFLFAVALAVGLTPELLPMIVSVTLARGAVRMARGHVIVKRLSAVQDLGAMDVLFVVLALNELDIGQSGVGILNATFGAGPGSVRPAEITDGASHTIVIAECTDRLADEGGRWVSGFNCFSHDNGSVNGVQGSDIFSFHPAGAHAGFADGRVEFISKYTAPYVVGAICTRSGGESVNDY